LILSNGSSADCSSLLVISDADHGYHVLVKNISSPLSDHDTTALSSQEYKYKNCLAAFSLVAYAAVVITRSVTAKLVNCGSAGWNVVELSKESLNLGNRWSYYGVEFSTSGYRALALDRRGKFFVFNFESELERRDTI
jgi:hypothetical protein